jgi:protein O-mannosyl-transferase
MNQLAVRLGVDSNEIVSFIKSRWPEKYRRLHQSELISKEKRGIFKTWQWLLFFCLLVGLVYFNSLNNAFVSDDISGIQKYKLIGDLSSVFSVPMGFFTPLTRYLVFTLFGLSPIAYRVPYILIHGLSAGLIYLILKEIKSHRIGLITALLFAVHPIFSESITWISGGPYAQYSFFLLLSLLAYIKGDKNMWWYCLSVMSFMLGIISMEKAIVWPVILLLFDYCFRGRFYWKKYIPFVIINGTWGVFYISRIGQRVSSLASDFYVQQGVDNPLIQIPIAITSYLELIFWPQGLTIYHSEMLFSLSSFLVKTLIFILYLIIIFICFKKNKYLFFWLSFFLITLSPTLTPLRISWTVAERYVYLGVVGILAVVGLGFDHLLRRDDFKYVVWFCIGLVLLLLSTRTIVRNVDWKNEDNLWLATAKYSPSSPNNHNNLGDVYARHGDFPKAAEEFKIAIQLKPNYADAYHNLGITYQRMGQFDYAIKSYVEATKLNPRLWQSYQNLSMIYFESGDYQKAKEYIQTALSFDPDNPTLRQIQEKFETTNLGG